MRSQCFLRSIICFFVICSVSSMKALNSANVKSVAIVGGGIGGLTSAYHFAHIASKLTIYDEQAHPGTQGASAVAAGLMHPFTPTGGVIWKGIEGFDKSLKVLNECQEISDENLFTASKIVRPIRKQEDLKKWKRTKEQHPELLRFVDAREYEALAGCRADEIGGTDVESDIAGVVMERSAVVNPPMYLRALFKRVGQLCPSVEWVTRSLTPTHIELLKDNYDIVIVAAGPGFPTLWQATEAKDSIPNSSANGKVDDDANRLTDAYRLPFKYTRGQNLIYRQSDFETQFKEPVLRGEYLVPTESAVGCPSEASAAGDPDMAHNYEMQSSLSHTSMQSHSPYLIYGATHEYGDSIRDLSAPADADAAHELLSDRMGQLHPELIGKTPVGVNWGIRVMSERSHLGKVPVVGRHPRFENVWLVGGLGARGLIHHAIVGEILAEAALAGEEDVVPKEMRLSTQIHGLDRMLARERLKEKNSLTKESVKEH